MCYIHSLHVAVLVRGHPKWQYTPKGPKSHTVTKDLFKWSGCMRNPLFATPEQALVVTKVRGLSTRVILKQNYVAFQLF